MRKLLLAGLGVLFVAGAYYLAEYIVNSRQKPQAQVQKVVKTVYTDTVVNGNVPIVIRANGNLMAKHRIELYSEVSGIFRGSSQLFKAGQAYRKGETLLRIDDQEFMASVQSQKSNLLNLITGIMPDIRLDYPQSYRNWENYLADFSLNGATKALPEPVSVQEKNFITGRGVYAAYYQLKNLETRLSKHIIRAPFDGILTEALVNEGTLIRNGQKLGEFIDPSGYEMEMAVNKSFAPFLTEGKKVDIKDLEGTSHWTGKVARINGKVDMTTQTIKVYVEVQGEGLREGMYLEASMHAKDAPDAVQLDRSLMVDQSKIYAVKDTILELIEVKPLYFSDTQVVLSGIKDGTTILSKTVPGAYPGMVVKVAQEQPVAGPAADGGNSQNAAE